MEKDLVYNIHDIIQRLNIQAIHEEKNILCMQMQDASY